MKQVTTPEEQAIVEKKKLKLKDFEEVIELVEGIAWRGIKGDKYIVIQPPLPEKELLERAKDYVLSRISFEDLSKLNELYEWAAKRALKELKKKYDETLLNSLIFYLKRDIEGLGKLDPIMKDPYVEDVTLPARGGRRLFVYLAGKGAWLETNIELTEEEARQIVLKLAERVGKQVSLAVPRLEGKLPDGSRVHALYGPAVSEGGTTFTIRKFVVRPKIEQLISWGAVSVEAAAYLWLLAEHGISGFIAGETGSGKTTFLNALLSLLPKHAHIVTVEDSVTGDCEITYVKDGKVLRGEIGKLIDEELRKRGMEEGASFVNDSSIKVYAINEKGKVILAPVTMFYKHKVFKDIYEIRTSTGRTIKTTGDHSLFTINNEGEIVPVEVRNISVGDYIVVPKYLPPMNPEPCEWIDLLSEEHIGKLLELQEKIERKLYVKGPTVRRILKNLPEDIRSELDKTGYRTKNGVLPLSEFLRLIGNNMKLLGDNLYLATRNSHPIPSKIPLNESFMEFFGLWLADGSYNLNRSVIISCNEAKCVEEVSDYLGTKVSVHSDGISLMLNSVVFRAIMEHILKFSGDAHTKRVPEWIFSLDERKIAAFLRGYFSGDGNLGKYEIEAVSTSYHLLKDIQTLLLRLGILSRVKEKREKGGYDEELVSRYRISISDRKNLRTFKKKVGFFQEEKNKKLSSMGFISMKVSTEAIPIDAEKLSTRLNLDKKQKSSIGYSYIRKTGKITKSKLRKVLTAMDGGDEYLQRLNERIVDDLYLDKVTQIKRVSDGRRGIFVYDLAVKGYENFICEGIVAHNTPEIYLPEHRNWTSLIGQPPGMGVKGMEIPDLLRDVLRMRPDYVVVGESRGAEVRLLVQFIHIGHTSFCLPKDEPVLVEVDGEVKFQKIGEIVERAVRGEIKEIRVPALNRNGRVVWAAARSVIRKEGPKEFVEIEAKGAPTFRASIGHPVYVIRSGKPLLIPAKDVRLGDKIPVAGDIPAKISKHEIYATDVLKSGDKSEIYVSGASDLLDELKPSQLSQLVGHKVTSFNLFDWRRRRTAFPLDIYEAVDPKGHYKREIKVMSSPRAKCSIPNKIPLNFEFGYIIGLFLADGSTSYLKNGLRISLNQKDREIANKFRKYAKNVFGLETKCYQRGRSLELVVHSAILGKLFRALDLESNGSKRRVPDLTFEAPEEFRLGMLVGYIEGDGHVRRHGRNSYMIVAYSVSRELAYSLAFLSRTIGIDVSVKERDNSRGFGRGGRIETIYVIRVLGGKGLAKLSEALNLSRPTIVPKEPVYLAKVTSVKFITLDSPLYDFEVPGYGNFAHSGGVITSNTTFHASTIEGVIARLKGDPINLTNEQIADFKMAALLRKEGNFRGVVRIAELSYDLTRDDVILRDIFVRKRGRELLGNPIKSSQLFIEIAAKEGVPRSMIVREYQEKLEELRRRVERAKRGA